MFMRIVSLVCLFEFNLAELIANHGAPKSVDTTLSLRQISDIDLEKNSISIQVGLWTFWSDPSLALSHNSTE